MVSLSSPSIVLFPEFRDQYNTQPMTTIRDVAKFTGVSPITVSRVVNNSENVRPETRDLVKKAIAKLGYIPNLTARSLRSRQTLTLALVVPDITNVFWTTVARGVEDAAQDGGYSIMLCNTDENPEKFTKYLNTVIQQRVDGVLLVPYSTDIQQLSQLIEMDIPTVIIDRRVNEWDGDSVYCDSVAGAQALTQHLINLGHRKIALFSGPAATSTSEDRVAGYCLALHKAGIPINERLIWYGEFREATGKVLTRELLGSGQTSTAIMAANNKIASGVLEELRHQKKNVPGEIAVCCFDEIPEVERLFPFLTNVSQPAYDMGANAVQLLISRINSTSKLPARKVILPTRLLLRYSCGRFLQGSNNKAAEVSLSLIPDVTDTQLVRLLDTADRELLMVLAPNLAFPIEPLKDDSILSRPDKNRLMLALDFRKPDRLPFLAGRVLNKAIIESVLGQTIQPAIDGYNFDPEKLISFAQQTGIDAVPCDFTWQFIPNEISLSDTTTNKLQPTFPPPALAQQLSVLENLLRSAEGSGVGVFVRFNSFYEASLKAFKMSGFSPDLISNPPFEKMMDTIVKQQERIIRAICDRFGRDICFITIKDDFIAQPELVRQSIFYRDAILPRLEKMIKPAQEHRILVALDTQGQIENAIPDLFSIGIGAFESVNLSENSLNQLMQDWQAKIVFIGGLSTNLFALPQKEIEEQVLRTNEWLGNFPGIILCTDQPLSEGMDFPVHNFNVFVRYFHAHHWSSAEISKD